MGVEGFDCDPMFKALFTGMHATVSDALVKLAFMAKDGTAPMQYSNHQQIYHFLLASVQGHMNEMRPNHPGWMRVSWAAHLAERAGAAATSKPGSSGAAASKARASGAAANAGTTGGDAGAGAQRGTRREGRSQSSSDDESISAMC